MSSTTIAIVASLIAVHFALREATFERATVRRSSVTFPPVFSLRAMFWLGVPMFLFAAYKLSVDVRSRSDWVYVLVAVGLSFLAFFACPATIYLDEAGVRTKRFLGLQVRQLRWPDIASAAHSKVTKETVLYGHDGSSITHTQFHVDPSRFELELRKRLRVPFLVQ